MKIPFSFAICGLPFWLIHDLHKSIIILSTCFLMMEKRKKTRLDNICSSLLRLMFFYGEDYNVYAFFNKDNNEIYGFTDIFEIEKYRMEIPVNIFKTNIKNLYLLCRIQTYPDIDEFQVILLESRRLSKKSIIEYASILSMDIRKYELIEEGSKIIDGEIKREICDKLKIRVSNSNDIFASFSLLMEGL